MKKLLISLSTALLFVSLLSAQNSAKPENNYILTEIWKAKPAWYELAPQERTQFFEDKIKPVLMGAMGAGADILGTAVNNNTGSERMDYQFMAVWTFPDKKSSDQLEKAAKQAGFLKYFDQVNFSGEIIPPPALNKQMIELTSNSDTSDDLKKAIQQNLQEMGQAMSSGNPKLLATHFTEDAMMKFPGLDPIQGREAIAKHHEMMIEQGISVRPRTNEVERLGNTGYEIGTYELLNKEDQIIDSGTYSSIWKKVDGEWKIYRDVVSSSKR
ncbi:nuclear transport factor 2 family protein [Salinimicrobium sp. HB62]|uniref:nuclear transport factor 2 family protein n=1 Tax=Salinimicrobium sp. HB62 TaxID=3077781 RepID=UPI002D767EEB|nr:nuclear transport factor 2 family protein [Salinimicrobium sp. HB62]